MISIGGSMLSLSEQNQLDLNYNIKDHNRNESEIANFRLDIIYFSFCVKNVTKTCD